MVEMINNKLSEEDLSIQKRQVYDDIKYMESESGYGDDWVKYIYVCVEGYNEIWTFRIEQGCWESYRDVEYNYSCN